MKELKELKKIAVNYAVEKSNELINNAIAQAYADGYADGYKDREEEILGDLRDIKTEYVDLGLPSGTLWANDYETENDSIAYYTHEEASKFSIPSTEQWKELKDCCCWKYVTKYGLPEDSKLEEVICIGPNGNSIRFNVTGFFELVHANIGSVYCWLKDESELNEKNCVCIKRAYVSFENRKRHYSNAHLIISLFTGFKLPIRLVRSK